MRSGRRIQASRVYLRKSVRVGPFRFNLSGSGVGVSVGISGLRIGMGPRETYIHAGRGGLYYRRTLGSPNASPRQPRFDVPAGQAPGGAATHDDLVDVESGDVLAMQDSSAADLLAVLNGNQAKWRMWPWVAVGSIGAVVYLASAGAQASSGMIASLAVAGATLTPIAAMWDRRRRLTVLLYELEPDLKQFTRVFTRLSMTYVPPSRLGTWRPRAVSAIASATPVPTCWSAGRASGLPSEPPPIIKTNISVPVIPAGKQMLCFFPERLLVFERSAVGAVSYADLQLDAVTGRFIEDGEVPADSRSDMALREQARWSRPPLQGQARASSRPLRRPGAQQPERPQ
jgi:hypothetical protein